MIYFITGGERSGKSAYAQSLALEHSDNPIYLATAKKWDKDFEERINRHRQDRDSKWVTIEEEMHISKAPEEKTVVIDCVTLWLTNFLSSIKDKEKVRDKAIEEFNLLAKKKGTFIIISNEIGMGLHASSKAGRDFVEVQGWLNQHIAEKADKVYLMISGIALEIK